MKRFATALLAQRDALVSDIEDKKTRDWYESVGLTTTLLTTAAPLIISACSVEEANKLAVTHFNLFPIEEGWFNHEASSVEIP
jgi:hypothetical protein